MKHPHSENDHTAFLSNRNGFTVFQFDGRCIRFAAPYSLEYYTEVRQWDSGCLVVMAQYSHNETPEEEYIDLNPILTDLYVDTQEFLSPIREVKISYD